MGTMPMQLCGCVTTWRSIAGKSADHLEDVLGFGRGRLKAGYLVYRLAELVGPNDFEWKDTTRYSGGWTYDAASGEWIQRQDEERWKFLKRNGYDVRKGDAEFDRFMGDQQFLLNVRTGWAQIVKVVPKAPGNVYPDSKAGRIPQWSIPKNRPKTFTLLFDVGPRESCPAELPSQ